MEETRAVVETLFGTGRDLEVHQMVLRGIVAYPLALFMIRVGDKRFVGEMAAFDFLVAIVIGAIISRGISGNAPFWASLATSFGIILLHRALAMAALRWQGLATLIKGRSTVLVRDGEIDWEAMRKTTIGERDLEEALRLNGRVEELERVRIACLERNGQISVIPRE